MKNGADIFRAKNARETWSAVATIALPPLATRSKAARGLTYDWNLARSVPWQAAHRKYLITIDCWFRLARSLSVK
jgi:hypothetical protein